MERAADGGTDAPPVARRSGSGRGPIATCARLRRAGRSCAVGVTWSPSPCRLHPRYVHRSRSPVSRSCGPTPARHRHRRRRRLAPASWRSRPSPRVILGTPDRRDRYLRRRRPVRAGCSRQGRSVHQWAAARIARRRDGPQSPAAHRPKPTATPTPTGTEPRPVSLAPAATPSPTPVRRRRRPPVPKQVPVDVDIARHPERSSRTR